MYLNLSLSDLCPPVQKVATITNCQHNSGVVGSVSLCKSGDLSDRERTHNLKLKCFVFAFKCSTCFEFRAYVWEFQKMVCGEVISELT